MKEDLEIAVLNENYEDNNNNNDNDNANNDLSKLPSTEIIHLLRDALVELCEANDLLHWRRITNDDLPGHDDEVLRFGKEWSDVLCMSTFQGTMLLSADDWHDLGFYWFRPLRVPVDCYLL